MSVRWEARNFIVRNRLLSWLEAPMRRALFHARSVRDLRHLAGFYKTFRSSLREQPIADQINMIFDAFGGMMRPFQDRGELVRLVEYLKPMQPKIVMEIGTAKGGTLYMLSLAAAPDATLISVDLPAGVCGGGYPRWKGRVYRRMIGAMQKLHLLRMDSHSAKALEAVEKILNGRKIDFLLIDGDHSYEGAMIDFQRYRHLVRTGGLIAFHDIVPSKYDPRVNVHAFWKTLKPDFKTTELIASHDAGMFGIGVIEAPELWERAA